MNLINNYSFSPQCDRKTGLSMGLSLFVASGAVATFLVLFHLDHMSLTHAYVGASAGGASPLLIGGIIACVRHKKPVASIQSERLTAPATPQIEEPTSAELEEPTASEIDSYLRNEESLIYKKEQFYIHEPDEKHPHLYFTVDLELPIAGKKTVVLKNIEILSRTRLKEGEWKCTFIFDNVEYTKKIATSNWLLVNPVTLAMEVEDSFFEIIGALVGAKERGKGAFLSKQDVKILKKEGYDATIFLNLFHCPTYVYPDCMWSEQCLFIPGLIDAEIDGQRIIINREGKCPEQLLESLKHHPSLQAKLAGTTWTLDLPPEATSIYTIKTGDHLEVFYKQPLSA